jgi:CRP-like cAMP-binding protein
MKSNKNLIDRLSCFGIMKELASIPVLLEAFVEVLEEKEFSEGCEIVTKGEAGDCAYLLFEGTVEVFDYTMAKEPYTRAVLNDKMNPIFGEIALVAESPRLATVVARSKCKCWQIRHNRFVKFGNENPRAGLILLREVASILVGHLEKTNRDVLQLFEALVQEVESGSVQ